MKRIIWGGGLLLWGIAGILWSQPADLWEDDKRVKVLSDEMLPLETMPADWQESWDLQAEEMMVFAEQTQQAQRSAYRTQQSLETERWRLETSLQDLMQAQQRCAQHLILSLAEEVPDHEETSGSLAEQEVQLAHLMAESEALQLRIFLLDEAIDAASQTLDAEAEALEWVEAIQTAEQSLPALRSLPGE